jgi:hypothetical protein
MSLLSSEEKASMAAEAPSAVGKTNFFNGRDWQLVFFRHSILQLLDAAAADGLLIDLHSRMIALVVFNPAAQTG